MISKFSILMLATSLSAMSLTLEASGFRKIKVSDVGNKDLTVGLWYPSDQPVADRPNTEFELAVALDAPMSRTNGGLILISHGYGGWYAGHADTAAALADAGFLVAAPSHTGNTWSDMSSMIEQWALDRPRHISRTIDHLLEDKVLKNHIDLNKIGVYGFSAGGYTALGLIGGKPDLDHAKAFCVQAPDEYGCAEGLVDRMIDAKMQSLPAEAWGHDPRISAATISAPGLGFAYTSASLDGITADVQLWSGELDEQVPTQTNAALLATRLPQKPETNWIRQANHFAFMVVSCRESFKRDDPEEYEVICGDAEGFDRRVFHEEMHQEMVRFFNKSFAGE